MADNVVIKDANGTNVTIAADEDSSGRQIQKIKLLDGTADSTTVIPGSANGLYVQGQVAHDATAAGNPILLGGKARPMGTATVDVSASGDSVTLLATPGGRLYVESVHPNCWRTYNASGAVFTNKEVKAAPGSGLCLYVTDVLISNGATAGTVSLLDGSGGTVLLKVYLAINGGCSMSLRTPLKLTANTKLCVTSTSVTTHTITTTGYTAA